MQEDLKQLLQLQEMDKSLDELQLTLQKLLMQIEEIKTQKNENQQQLEEKKKQLMALQVKRKTKETELLSQEEKIRKHEAELNTVKSNEAYKALLTEIDNAKKGAGLIEDEILQLFEKADLLSAELKNDEAILKESQQKQEEEILELETQIQKMNTSLENERKEREDFTDSIKKELLSAYNYIRGKKGGVAIVTIEGDCCSGCNTHLTPSLINEVKKGKNLIRCDSCSRILFDPASAVPAG